MAKVDCNKIPYAKAQREIKALLNSIRSYFKSEYNMDVRVAIDYGMDVNLANVNWLKNKAKYRNWHEKCKSKVFILHRQS